MSRKHPSVFPTASSGLSGAPDTFCTGSAPTYCIPTASSWRGNRPDHERTESVPGRQAAGNRQRKFPGGLLPAAEAACTAVTVEELARILQVDTGFLP